ncbi:MAG: hypothetical protein CMJ62_15505 [Planctomycetaceae bacterium]|nr:hypothetical protein [Planctomycetaceae bacterium]
MPATEQTWRSQKLMHAIFGISSLVLLLSTYWMFQADHSREWKGYQRNARNIERDLTRWQKHEFQTREAQDKVEELQERLKAVRAKGIDNSLYAKLVEKIQHAPLDFDLSKIKGLYDQLQQASDKTEIRQQLIARLQKIVDKTKSREKELSRLRKFQNANYDAAKAKLSLGVRDSLSDDEMAALQAQVERARQEVANRTETYEELNTYRKDLEDTFGQLTKEETAASKALEDKQADSKRLEVAAQVSTVTYFQSSFPFLGKKWLELPILDAFNSPLTIDNHHYPELLVDYNFKGVARFDRCTTCHRSIDKASPRTPGKPSYLPARELSLWLETPGTKPESAETLREVYGIRIASRGLVHKNDVTVSYVRPSSPAALAIAEADAANTNHKTGLQLRQGVIQAKNQLVEPDNGLQVGDVILAVNGNKVLEEGVFQRFLMQTTKWGEPLKIRVRRGLPQPYTSHPRLDLFTGPESPHPLQEIGCTSCHEGQGSATAFKWVSHTPSNLDQREEWRNEHGWFNNHHWSFPMYANRFSEASCLRCHHEVTDLEPSERFPEPPASKLTAGHKLINSFGCFGCHEINGYNGPDQRVGPDLRLEPNYFAVAQELGHLAERRVRDYENQSYGNADQLAEVNRRLAVLAEIRDLAGQVARDWEHAHGARQQLRELLSSKIESAGDEPLLPVRENLARALNDVDGPGHLRKVGPSLRYVGHKLDEKFLYDWIQQPKHFRPGTNMPQFFGLWEHLDGTDLEVSQKFEPIEVQGIVTYLLQRTQDYQPVDPPTGIDPVDSAEQVQRGKQLFQTQGCLACHTHEAFPTAKPTVTNHFAGELPHGPDLSSLGSKLIRSGEADGPGWLKSWLREPSNYHVRTRMPNLLLEPIEQRDPTGKLTGVVTDPVADISAFLLSFHSDWQPVPAAGQPADPEALDELVLKLLRNTYHQRAAERYLKNGIPETMRAELKGAELELVGSASTEQKLLYVGRKAVAKYGCYGCHDVPGFEDAKPIGTGLADWGRKDPSKLDFAHITHHLHHEREHHPTGHESAKPEHSDLLDPYFEQLIGDHDRVGFGMQKLRQPRSYDYKNVTNKGYNERLRMPLFPLSDQQREAVLTFVLGLVAEPPRAEYVNRPQGREKAIVEGRQVLEKYNCGGCHVLETERWSLAFQADDFRSPPTTKAYPFLQTHYNRQQTAESEQKDHRDRMHAVVSGFPALSDEDGLPIVWDEEEDPLEDEENYESDSVSYRFDLWKPALLNGNAYEVGLIQLQTPASTIEKKFAPRGGSLTRYLLPQVVALEQEVNPSAKGSEAWGWLPPPLVGEGKKVQTDWLHGFLLDPHPIRPSLFLHMPRFNMSSSEATKLVNYFAAMDQADYPYEFDTRTRSGHLASEEAEYRSRLRKRNLPEPAAGQMARLDAAMNIVVNNNYCVKCHLMGDFEPEGTARAKAPDLANIFRRLRPEFVRRWIANPKQIHSYTSMPVNIPYDPDADHAGGVSQDLYTGTSIQQLDGLVDLLMNFDTYSENRSPVAPLVQPAELTAELPADSAAVAGGNP